MPQSIFNFTASASNDFQTAANWFDVTTGSTSSVVPGINDEALVTLAGTISGYGNVAELALTGTAERLNVDGFMQGNLVYLGGTVTLSGLIYAQNLLDIGDGSTDTLAGTIPTTVSIIGSQIEAVASVVNAAGIIVGQGGDSGTLAASVQGTQGGTVLSYGDGGSTVLTVGAGTGSVGLVSVSGTGSALGAFGRSVVGSAGGAGTVVVTAGARGVFGADGYGLTLGAGGSGVLSFSGASQGLFQGQAVVGGSSVGSLSVTGGSGVVAQSGAGAALLVGASAGGSGSVLISDVGSFANISGGLDVGGFGAGVMIVENHSRVASGNTPSSTSPALSIGVDAGGRGTFSVLGQSEFIAQGAGISVGVAGTGELDVNSGTVTVTVTPGAGVSALDSGVLAGSQGVVNVGDGGVIFDTQSAGMIIGDSGSGTMAIGGASDPLGGLVLTGDPSAAAGLSLGVASAADGTVSVSGASSGLAVYGTVADGVSGAGSIAVADGGRLVAELGPQSIGLALGVNAGGAGTMSVDSGAQVYFVGHSYIGDAGVGSLSITGGSSFTGVGQYQSGAGTFQTYGQGAAMALGLASTGTGDVLISDPSTFVSLTGALVIGDSGRGSLSVTNSAFLLVNGGSTPYGPPAVELGYEAGSSGTLSLSDQAQMLVTSAGVGVGNGGTGELDILQTTLTINVSPAGYAGGALGIDVGSVVNVAGGTIIDVNSAGTGVAGTLAIIQGGTVLTGGELSMGFASSPGLISVSGSASGLGVFGLTNIYGTVSVNDGARFVGGSSADTFAIYDQDGMMSLSGGAEASVLGQVEVGGYFASGTLSVTGGSGFSAQAAGAQVSDNALVLEENAVVLVSGPLSYMNLSGGVLIGNDTLGDLAASASMTLANGALMAVTAVTASDTAVSVGNDADGDSLTVIGSGSTLLDTGLFAVGGSAAKGFAAVTISTGATVTVSESSGQAGPAATIGDPDAFAGAGSAVIVDGAGSDWTIGGALLISGNPTGHATLLVSDGGQVNAGQVSLNDIYSGIITVEGAGSELNATVLTVGSTSPAGTLIVKSFGLIHVSNGIALSGSADLSGGTLLTATTLSMAVGSDVTGVSASSTVSAGAIVDLGNIVASGGTLSCVGTITGSGLISIAGGVLVLGNAEAAGVGVDYSAAGGSLVAQSAADIAGTISGWAAGDFIDLKGVTATSESYANGTLSLFGGSSQLVGTLHFAGSLATNNFTLSALAGGGTEIGYHS